MLDKELVAEALAGMCSSGNIICRWPTACPIKYRRCIYVKKEDWLKLLTAQEEPAPEEWQPKVGEWILGFDGSTWNVACLEKYIDSHHPCIASGKRFSECKKLPLLPFSIGDKVYITRSWAGNNLGAYYISQLDSTIGKLGEIEEIAIQDLQDPKPIYKIGRWWYPECVLSKEKPTNNSFECGQQVLVRDGIVSKGQLAKFHRADKDKPYPFYVDNGSECYKYRIPCSGNEKLLGTYYGSLEEMAKDERREKSFRPYQRVLVRDRDIDVWAPAFYSYEIPDNTLPHEVIGGLSYRQCIPYEGNEHLAGTTNEPA